MNNSWVTDSVLGTPFQQLTFDFGTEPTEHTTAYATLVRYTGSSGPDSLADDWAARPAILWIHGLTDYFFHKHVAEYFHHQGFAFYALDLRKCGRSLRDGQTAHHCLDIAEYYEELDAAAELITAAHEQAPHKRAV